MCCVSYCIDEITGNEEVYRWLCNFSIGSKTRKVWYKRFCSWKDSWTCFTMCCLSSTKQANYEKMCWGFVEHPKGLQRIVGLINVRAFVTFNCRYCHYNVLMWIEKKENDRYKRMEVNWSCPWDKFRIKLWEIKEFLHVFYLWRLYNFLTLFSCLRFKQIDIKIALEYVACRILYILWIHYVCIYEFMNDYTNYDVSENILIVL